MNVFRELQTPLLVVVQSIQICRAESHLTNNISCCFPVKKQIYTSLNVITSSCIHSSRCPGREGTH
jgi:hypothetical protein